MSTTITSSGDSTVAVSAAQRHRRRTPSCRSRRREGQARRPPRSNPDGPRPSPSI
jgi:hypothetical protein